MQLAPPGPDATADFAIGNRDIFVSTFVQFVRFKTVTALRGVQGVV